MKTIMENWRKNSQAINEIGAYLTGLGILGAVGGAKSYDIFSLYNKAAKLAKQKYFIPRTKINKISDPKEKRAAQDSTGYKEDAFRHILAAFTIKHKNPSLSVQKLGELLEFLQEKYRGSEHKEDDKRRDLKNNDIGLELAEKYKKNNISNYQHYIDEVENIIKDGDFYTTSTDSSGGIRKYKDLLIARQNNVFDKSKKIALPPKIDKK